MNEQTMALRRAFADVERLYMGGYETRAVGKKVIVRKMKNRSQEKGIYRKIAGSWDGGDMFAIRTLFKMEESRDERKRQGDERIAREARIQEQSKAVDLVLAKIQKLQVSPDKA